MELQPENVAVPDEGRPRTQEPFVKCEGVQPGAGGTMVYFSCADW